jgi:hypothetical protein
MKHTSLFLILLFQQIGIMSFAQSISVSTNPDHTRGATLAYSGGTVATANLSNISEKGVCWSTTHNPTIADNKVAATGTAATFLCRMNNLLPATLYYVRAYAISTTNEANYGEEIKIITIPKGNNTFTMNIDSASNPDHFRRIKAAMTSACDYHDNLTSIVSQKSVNYGSGTPTAEASYGGWMRFGPNASYQRTGTALHEMAHTVGVGTQSMWSNTNLHANNIWLGERTTKVLKTMLPLHKNTTYPEVHGDTQHFWPFGINGAQEDDGTDLLYVMNSLLVQAMGEDGLPPVSSYNFATPAYTLDINEGKKYYIKGEDVRAGRDSSFVVEDAQGKLVCRKMTAAQALNEDSAAWYIIFKPQSRYYTIQNVATGKYFLYSTSGIGLQNAGQGNAASGISTANVPSNANAWFQLLASRTSTRIGNNAISVQAKGFWIVHPASTPTPSCFAANSVGTIATQNFNISNTATLQRWLLLSEDEIADFEMAVNAQGTLTLEAGATYSIRAAESNLCLYTSTADSVNIVNYSSNNEARYAAMRWTITPSDLDETHYTIINAGSQAALTIEPWTAVGGEAAAVTGKNHTKAIAFDANNDAQQLRLAFAGNSELNGQITPTFTIANDDSYRLDNYSNLRHMARVGSTRSAAITVPANQRWFFVLETHATVSVETSPFPDLKLFGANGYLYVENLPANATMAVFDITGKLHFSSKSKDNSFAFALPKGLYIVAITTDQTSLRKKVLVH